MMSFFLSKFFFRFSKMAKGDEKKDLKIKAEKDRKRLKKTENEGSDEFQEKKIFPVKK